MDPIKLTKHTDGRVYSDAMEWVIRLQHAVLKEDLSGDVFERLAIKVTSAEMYEILRSTPSHEISYQSPSRVTLCDIELIVVDGKR